MQEMLEILDAVVETVPSVENVVFIGNLQELLRLWREFNSDPLALWLRWRGPFSMMAKLTAQAAAEKREHVHPCLACRAALGPQENRERLYETYPEILPSLAWAESFRGKFGLNW